MKEEVYHVPVLLQEVLHGLQINPAGTYVDCTFGGGGHSLAILQKLNEEGRLVVFDQDPDAEVNVPDDKRVLFIPQNFRHLRRFLKLHHITQVDGILADLGVSSHQINMPGRGFSTRFEGPLDMRMNRQEEKKASDVIRHYSEAKLHQVFEKYGEVSNARTLAHTIVSLRRSHRLDTIREFKNALYPVVKGNPDKYFAQVFQAIRIEVNDELNALTEMLEQSVEVLKEGGRIAIITFHSLEDRIVKNFFKNGSAAGQEEPDLYGRTSPHPLKTITRKPVTPSEKEIRQNTRARSAKLRVAEKIK